MAGKELTVRVLGVDKAHKDYGVRVFLCDGNFEPHGIVLDI